MSGDEVTELAHQALALLVNAPSPEAEKIAEKILDRVLADSDVEQGFSVCRGFAEAGRKALVELAGSHAPIFENGEQWTCGPCSPGELEEPTAAFSVRFLVAYANGHEDTARAHYNALLLVGEDIRVRGVSRLFRDIAALCWSATEQQEDGGG